MIDGSEKRNRQLAFELQNSHVCEKRSKDKGSIKITSIKIGSFGSHSLIRSNRLNFDKICIFHKHLRSSCGAERKFVKKNFQERISRVSPI